ncbi:4-(cytidine 5'-diphospho)-2-C-methyl-D-erythritol kinase [Salinarimonas ramus]|uniref:4-diphosphocytidyl-2-C-methyl-D-erythritol kinase n=1 Tax=Salinarimonas ramus TaxID=690164 RepID=A0A917V3H4_9HYPH|nr:4-(cytidine 5'-diphospho)-2-C-methyl-D-erythritol kinase [Salinarimonas ramus]GGK31697.1 4-diphosphocytidyl-2-C-methyl-D-erythritol kinase [Salinarimonas ramus]
MEGSSTRAAFAPAKVNLTLAVAGRRADGYHLLSSLVAFAEVGDDLTLTPGPVPSLAIDGPGAAVLAVDDDNLVLKAARALATRVPDLVTGAFCLTKRLPVASGIGGGSADAAAALRLLARANDIATDDPRVVAAAAETGADVPVCLAGRVCLMEGIGERLGPSLPCPALPAVLVNPGVPVETRAVFRALALAPGKTRGVPPSPAPMPGSSVAAVIAALASAGNDLQAPAISVAPIIARTLDAVARTNGCALARMSGSGATCFGLYHDDASAHAAARSLAEAHPGWWVVATRLGPALDDAARAGAGQEGPPTVRSAPTRAASTASP